jgi:AraC-like DNA-binding protein
MPAALPTAGADRRSLSTDRAGCVRRLRPLVTGSRNDGKIIIGVRRVLARGMGRAHRARKMAHAMAYRPVPQADELPVVRPPNSFFPPPEELSAAVQFGFTLQAYRQESKAAVRRLPSGRATIYYAADIRTSNGASVEAGLFCEGPRTRAWELDAECSEVIGFRVRAGALGSLLGRPAREIRGRTIPLASVWGSEASALLERMSGAASRRERRDLLASALIRRYRPSIDADDSACVVARTIERQRGGTPIALVARRVGVCERLLLRRFDESVGVTPKQYARITRFRATLAQLPEARGDLARLALERGFCDQAHLIHEFQALVGCAPAEFAGGRHRFSAIGAQRVGFRSLPNCERQLYSWLGHVSCWLDAS